MKSLLRGSVVCAFAMLAGCGGSGSSEGSTTASTGGETTSSSGSTSNASGQGEEPAFPMPTAQFLGAVTAEAVPELCADTSPLRTCYPSTDADLCARAFTQAMMSCGEAMQSTLPPTVDEESADPIATAVATCARVAFQGGLEQAGIARTADCPLAR